MAGATVLIPSAFNSMPKTDTTFTETPASGKSSFFLFYEAESPQKRERHTLAPCLSPSRSFESLFGGSEDDQRYCRTKQETHLKERGEARQV